jgi:hypothetical protein
MNNENKGGDTYAPFGGDILGRAPSTYEREGIPS